MDYEILCREFWDKAKMIGYIEDDEYCIAIGQDTLGAEDVILDNFYASTEEEWKIGVKQVMEKHYSYDDLEEELECIGAKWDGEGEYVLEEWGDIRIYKIDEHSLKEISKEYEKRKLEGELRKLNYKISLSLDMNRISVDDDGIENFDEINELEADAIKALEEFAKLNDIDSCEDYFWQSDTSIELGYEEDLYCTLKSSLTKYELNNKLKELEETIECCNYIEVEDNEQ